MDNIDFSCLRKFLNNYTSITVSAHLLSRNQKYLIKQDIHA